MDLQYLLEDSGVFALMRMTYLGMGVIKIK